MALINVSHHELMYIFGILGNIVSLGVFLSPMPTFWRIFKKKSTEGFQALPYSVALFSATLLLYYAMLKPENATPIITINSVGFLIEAFYLVVFLIYAPNKARVYTAKLLGLFNVTFLALIILGTMVFAHGNDEHILFSKGGVREAAVGWICAVFSVCVFAAPLSVMRMVIRTKSVEYMPFWLSFSLTLCAVMWFFYGFLIQDFYIAFPNVLGFLLGITQMILYIVYKDSPKKKLNPLVINDSDIKQLQVELAIDVKNGKLEKINQEIGLENDIIKPEVVEINVHELGVQARVDGEVNKTHENIIFGTRDTISIINGNDVITIDGNVNVGDMSRGVSNV
ncbi:bidirectional sugar transporter SWEET9-like [Silene latifolia]|uniref:bidirectional sugar transporter SWEET9-like n=1 Tax=Silene latifolia TaxID=37657 RepID=UPI003D777EAC